MPWEETSAMRKRIEFVVALDSGMYTMSELCERFGVSRKTGYKWVERMEEEGLAGMADRSRRPYTSPGRTAREVEELIVSLRRRHAGWGPKKLMWIFGQRYPELSVPARSTVAAIVRRHGLTERRRARRRHQHPGQPVREATAPNELWTADFKGQFRTRDGVYCYPLTIADHHSRYLLACEALPSVHGRGVRPVFERLFRKHGLPDAIRTDNGVPFATTGIHGLSVLNVWWMQLGIQHERIEPGRPQQNGRHERMHRTLKAATIRPPATNLAAQQRVFDSFRKEYNTVRPHEALGERPPASVWRPSTRPYPKKIVKPDYPGHFMPRLVSNSGNLRLHNRQIFISVALKQEYVGLEEIDDGLWSIYYYDVLLGRFDERLGRLVS
jgi:putative transposase